MTPDPVRQKVYRLSHLLTQLEELEALGDDFEVASYDVTIKKPGGEQYRLEYKSNEIVAAIRMAIISHRATLLREFDELTGRKK